MKIHAAHLTGPPDGPVALLVPMLRYRIGDGTPRAETPAELDREMVAAAQPCPICSPYVGKFDRTIVCPDCVGGLPRVELFYPCPSEQVRTVTAQDGNTIGLRCPDCGKINKWLDRPTLLDLQELGPCESRVSAGVGTIQHVPVVDGPTKERPRDIAYIALYSDVAVLVGSDGTETDITLPPGVKPGDTVAIWTTAEEPSP